MSFNLTTAEVAAIAIFFTFLGVLINNGFNLLMHNKRAKFESDQKDRERVHNLRKDIYLNAAEQSIRIAGLITELSGANQSIDNSTKEFNNFCSIMYKLQLIADIELAKLANILIVDYSLLYMESLAKSQEINDKRLDLKSKYDLLNYTFEKISEIDELNRNNLRANTFDNLLFDKLNKEREFHTNIVENLRAEIRVIDIEVNDNVKKMDFETLEKIIQVREKTSNFDLLLRKGIYGENDFKEYEMEILKSSKKFKSEYGAFAEKIKKLME